MEKPHHGHTTVLLVTRRMVGGVGRLAGITRQRDLDAAGEQALDQVQVVADLVLEHIDVEHDAYRVQTLSD
ncbi:hypothetical protein, partial [Xanthomonas perforans]|uniref:hypothetical protein n=1 Tax=Xanthomonas perforans TaxID=442694 RepID=UPI001F221583